MPPSTSTTGTPQPLQNTATRWRKIARRAGLALAGALILLTVVFLLLPVWISNEQGRTYILDRFNHRLNGPHVSLDSWSLSWFHPTDLHNLRILQPDGSTLLACDHLTSGLTLWDILTNSYDLRSTTAENLELVITKNSDGTTSFDPLAKNAADFLRSIRGAVQLNNATISLFSAQTNQSLRLTDLQATLTIASSDTPFHLQIHAHAASAAQVAPEGDLAFNATFPPIDSLLATLTTHPDWSFLTDLDLSANHLPAALLCDFCSIDPAWADSLGNTLDTLQLSNHATPPLTESRLTLFLRGTAPSGEAPSLSAQLHLHLPDDQSPTATLSIPMNDDAAHFDAALRLSAPLVRLLKNINPLLGEINCTPTAPPASDSLLRINLTSLTLPLPPADPADADAIIRLVFPPLTFLPGSNASLTHQFQSLAGDSPSTTPINGTADLRRLSLTDHQLAYENFLITLDRSRINFSGTVNLDGSLNLLASIPRPFAGLSSGTSQVVLTGTIDAPQLKRTP